LSKLYVNEIAPKTSGNTITSSNLIDMPIPHCTIYTDTSTTLTNSASTEIGFNLVYKDTNSMADLANNAIVIPTGLGGLYYITAAVRQNNFNATRQLVYIMINDVISHFVEYPSYSANAGEYRSAEVSIMKHLDAGDSITCDFWHNYGSNQSNLTSSASSYPYQNHISVTRIGGE